MRTALVGRLTQFHLIPFSLFSLIPDEFTLIENQIQISVRRFKS